MTLMVLNDSELVDCVPAVPDVGLLVYLEGSIEFGVHELPI